MERMTIAAFVVASASVIVSWVYHHDAKWPFRHACGLVLPLVIIAFPEAMETAFRSSFRGRAHGGEPTPGSIMRVVGWGLLVILVVMHHWVGPVRAPV